MEIRIGFSRSKHFKIGSWLIRLAEKRPYSHAFIKYECPITNEYIVCQASKGYVNETHSDIFNKDNITTHYYRITLDDYAFKKILKFSKKNLGKKYSTKQIILIAIKKILKFEIKTKDHEESYICSEWASEILKQLGYLKPHNNLDYVTPSDLDKILKNLANEGKITKIELPY